jgi:hypothetical protein
MTVPNAVGGAAVCLPRSQTSLNDQLVNDIVEAMVRTDKPHPPSGRRLFKRYRRISRICSYRNDLPVTYSPMINPASDRDPSAFHSFL